MNKGKIPVAEYRACAKQFNPTNFDADAISSTIVGKSKARRRFSEAHPSRMAKKVICTDDIWWGAQPSRLRFGAPSCRT